MLPAQKGRCEFHGFKGHKIFPDHRSGLPYYAGLVNRDPMRFCQILFLTSHCLRLHLRRIHKGPERSVDMNPKLLLLVAILSVGSTRLASATLCGLPCLGKLARGTFCALIRHLKLCATFA